MFMGWFTASLGFSFFFFFFFFSYMDTFTMDGSVLNWMRDLAGYQLFFIFFLFCIFFLGPQMHCLSIHSELCPMF